MSTEHRVLAAELYQVLEEMLFIATFNEKTALKTSNGGTVLPRRDQNKSKFIDVMEKLLGDNNASSKPQK